MHFLTLSPGGPRIVFNHIKLKEQQQKPNQLIVKII